MVICQNQGVTPTAGPDDDGSQLLLSSAIARDALHVLSRTPHGLTSTELAERLGAHRVTIARTLADLDEYGLVVASHPPGQRVGRSVTYSVDRTRLRLLATSLSDYLLPPDM